MTSIGTILPLAIVLSLVPIMVGYYVVETIPTSNAEPSYPFTQQVNDVWYISECCIGETIPTSNAEPSYPFTAIPLTQIGFVNQTTLDKLEEFVWIYDDRIPILVNVGSGHVLEGPLLPTDTPVYIYGIPGIINSEDVPAMLSHGSFFPTEEKGEWKLNGANTDSGYQVEAICMSMSRNGHALFDCDSAMWLMHINAVMGQATVWS